MFYRATEDIYSITILFFYWSLLAYSQRAELVTNIFKAKTSIALKSIYVAG